MKSPSNDDKGQGNISEGGDCRHSEDSFVTMPIITFYCPLKAVEHKAKHDESRNLMGMYTKQILIL